MSWPRWPKGGSKISFKHAAFAKPYGHAPPVDEIFVRRWTLFILQELFIGLCRNLLESFARWLCFFSSELE